MLQQRFSIPNRKNEQIGPLHSEVRIYYLTPEELEKYRNLPPPRDELGRPLKAINLKNQWLM
jgi:hypothetical protein